MCACALVVGSHVRRCCCKFTPPLPLQSQKSQVGSYMTTVIQTGAAGRDHRDGADEGAHEGRGGVNTGSWAPACRLGGSERGKGK